MLVHKDYNHIPHPHPKFVVATVVPENFGILKRIKSKEAALFLPFDILVFIKSSSKDDVFTILSV
jgi:hypothetical protein